MEIVNKIAGAPAVAVLAIVLVLPHSAKAAELPESDDPIRLALGDRSAQQATTYVAGEILAPILQMAS